MGAVGSICSPCGGSSAKAPPPPKKVVGCNVAGYDFGPEEPAATNGTTNGTADHKAAVPEPAPAPTPPEPEAEPKPEPRPAPTTPIVLETLQGDWVNSMGAKITVTGTQVSLNGLLMKVHPVTINEDGTVASIGKIWQMRGWLEDERIEWKEAPSREVMEFARSVVWTKVSVEGMKRWTEQMKGLGYAGSSSDPLKRGIEGCCPGTCDAKASVQTDDADRDKKELADLNRLVTEWRVPGLKQVPPRLVIPDFSNRGHTGLSVEHVHYLATSFKEKGFQKRKGNTGHDIPVLVQEPTDSELGTKSISNWRSKLADEDGFAPKEHYESLFRQAELYTSLGNGHWNQALNLFGNECVSIYNKDKKYTIDKDLALQEAVEEGVACIILKKGIPLRDRETISRLLNSKREYKWTVHEDGTVNIMDSVEDTGKCKQFEAISKVLDAVELNCLVRQELGVKDSKRVGN